MGKSFEIPPNVLSSGTYACMFTVELVVIFQVVKQAVPEFSPRRGWQAGSRGQVMADLAKDPGPTDRKSTRLNSSHVKISYAVFCLKKKNRIKNVSYQARSSVLTLWRTERILRCSPTMASASHGRR